MNVVLDFFAELFELELSYSYINLCRSALSTSIYPIDGTPVGQHPLVIRLMKGIYHSRPPVPRYAATWDVSKVLKYLSTLTPLKHISLKDLTLKLTMLISLTSADRGQSLALMDILQKSISHSKVTFYITEITKTSNPTKKCKEIVLPAFDDKSLCVKHTLIHYLDRTKRLRGGKSRLLISYRRPHNAVTSATISRWIKTVLLRSGITGYGAHSTRGAATSSALNSGVPIQTIMRAADWSLQSTFTKFYKREQDNTEFGRAILQARN